MLLAVTLPGMSQAQRHTAVAFAVEDRIAQSLDQVHVILGPALAADPNTNAGRWLVAVIARDRLQSIAPQPKMRLLPDTLALPLPEAGQWSVWAGGGRILTRTPDGAGFATSAAAWPSYHLAAGRPAIVLYGGELDPDSAVLHKAALPVQMDGPLRMFDLNTGRAADRALGLPRVWRHAAALLLVAGLGHLGLLVADTWALAQIRDASQASLRQALQAIGQPAAADLEGAISAALARMNGAQGPVFVALLARVFAALEPQTGKVTASDLRYVADQNSLTLTLHAPDIATLQVVDSTLTKAGFRLTAGAATTAGGLAEQQMTLQASGT